MPQFSKSRLATAPLATSGANADAPRHPIPGLSDRSRSIADEEDVATSSSTSSSRSTPTASASAAASSPSNPHDETATLRNASGSGSRSGSGFERETTPGERERRRVSSFRDWEEVARRISAARPRSRRAASKSAIFSAGASDAARTSSRRTRTTGDWSCERSAGHTPRDRTSTARRRNLGLAAETRAWTCFGVHQPRSPSREAWAWSSRRDSRCARTMETSEARVTVASPGTRSTRRWPRASPAAA